MPELTLLLSLINQVRALQADLEAYARDAIIPANGSVIGPLDIPSIYPTEGHDNSFSLAKIDEEEGLVFGWASISATADGQLVVDSHNDIIEPVELEKAAYEYVMHFGDMGAMHTGNSVGKLIESLVLTPDKAKAMGINEPKDTGWWVGFKVDDEEVFNKVKTGEYKAFSIQGIADAEKVDA